MVISRFGPATQLPQICKNVKVRVFNCREPLDIRFTMIGTNHDITISMTYHTIFKVSCNLHVAVIEKIELAHRDTVNY